MIENIFNDTYPATVGQQVFFLYNPGGSGRVAPFDDTCESISGCPLWSAINHGLNQIVIYNRIVSGIFSCVDIYDLFIPLYHFPDGG